MNILDVLNEIWNQILAVTSIFVMPDWGGLIGLLPVIVLLGVVMPFLTFLALGIDDLHGPQAADQGRPSRKARGWPRSAPAASPIYPVGLPHCRRDALVYPSGHDPLRALPRRARRICPMCNLGRAGDHRHLHQLRPRPEGQPRAVAVRTHGRRRRRRRRGAQPDPMDPRWRLSSSLFSLGVDPRRARVRGARRPRRACSPTAGGCCRASRPPGSRPTPAS